MPSEETSRISQAEISVAIERITAQVDILKAVARLGKDIYTFRKPSLEAGMERLESFGRELQRSYNAFLLGTPFDTNTEKTRKSQKARQAEADEVIRQGKAAAARLAKKPNTTPRKKKSG
jgi:hypothetical protein